MVNNLNYAKSSPLLIKGEQGGFEEEAIKKYIREQEDSDEGRF